MDIRFEEHLPPIYGVLRAGEFVPSATEISQVIDDARLFARDPAHGPALSSGQFNRLLVDDAAPRTLTPPNVHP